jgi:hypothetical protein
LASEHHVAPNHVSNGPGATSNPFLDRDRGAEGAEPTASDRDGAHDQVRQPAARRDGARGLVVPVGEIADHADAGARLARVVSLGRPSRPSWTSRPRRVVAALRDSASVCTRALRARGAAGSQSWGVAAAHGLVLLLVVIVAVAALLQRDSARAARDDARRQLAAAEQSAAELSHANRVLSRERDGAVAAAREAARERSRAAAATRRWRWRRHATPRERQPRTPAAPLRRGREGHRAANL